jgi:hypothetical protein
VGVKAATNEEVGADTGKANGAWEGRADKGVELEVGGMEDVGATGCVGVVAIWLPPSPPSSTDIEMRSLVVTHSKS